VAGDGLGLDELVGAQVELLGMKTGAKITLGTDGQASAAATGTATGDISVLRTTECSWQTADVAGTSVTDYLTDAGSAIVVPQNIGQYTQFIRITLSSGETFYYYVQPSAGITFEGGKAYSMIITLTATGIRLSTNIIGWTDGGNPDEEATAMVE
jgi:hypothetical protein